MIIVWGFRVRFRTLSQGDFYCPRCDGDRHYHAREARRWFTLFWIPLIPLKVLGRVIECDDCSQQFDERVLTIPSSSQQAEAVSTARRVLTARIVEASDNSDASRAAAVAEMTRSGAVGYDVEQLDVDRAGTTDADLVNWASHLGQTVSANGAESVLYGAARIANADGPINTRERNLLTDTGVRLGLTALHVNGVLARAEIDAGSPAVSPPGNLPPPSV